MLLWHTLDLEKVAEILSLFTSMPVKVGGNVPKYVHDAPKVGD